MQIVDKRELHSFRYEEDTAAYVGISLTLAQYYPRQKHSCEQCIFAVC